MPIKSKHHFLHHQAKLSNVVGSCIWTCCLLLAAAAMPPNPAYSEMHDINSVVRAGIAAFPENGRRINAAFSPLDKEVVEHLIKQWAPIVWLAPQEKFMPLGVDEFLDHVHPEDKEKPFIPGMPMGDTSKKAFLVTNAKIDELLEDKNSFIYGRNPNESPVPIYAVVTLCPPETKPMEQITPNTVTTSTRGPYIPIALDPKDHQNNKIRRSSRLYPMFKRMRRDIPINFETPSSSSYELVMGETAQSPPKVQELPIMTSNTSQEILNSSINNFIANLADNVKFSFDEDQNENTFNKDNGPSVPQFHLNEGASVPVFHVTYWMFYPYSQGKTMCTLSLGPLGRIPFPAVYGYCLGRRKDIGSHIGDWEHMSLYFNGAAEPVAMYVSAHDAGAYYLYNRLTGSFEFKRQETRKGILQRPNFPKTVTTFNNHPVLFAAKGSHGLWTAPGKHRFVKVARLYDINGFGTPWNTWKSVDISYENLKSFGRSLAPTWLSFKGKWGNPKSKCHPFRRIGLNFCEYTDGPTGIPLKEPHFQCGATFH